MSTDMSAMDEAWLTYREAAEKLGVSRQAVRQKAIRGRWPRTRGNDGQARVQVPEQPYRVRTSSGQASDVSLMDSLKDHVASLKTENERLAADLAHERARADQAIAAFANLAERLDALAAARSRPWWRRFVG